MVKISNNLEFSVINDSSIDVINLLDFLNFHNIKYSISDNYQVFSINIPDLINHDEGIIYRVLSYIDIIEGISKMDMNNVLTNFGIRKDDFRISSNSIYINEFYCVCTDEIEGDSDSFLYFYDTSKRIPTRSRYFNIAKLTNKMIKLIMCKNGDTLDVISLGSIVDVEVSPYLIEAIKLGVFRRNPELEKNLIKSINTLRVIKKSLSSSH